MNPAMKQRLVGTLVLGSLALILIQLLLDGEGVERPPLSTEIPPPPVFDTTPLPEPERPIILADTQTPDSSSEVPADTAANTTTTPDANSATPAASTSEPALDAAGLPEAWTVRLGSFGNRANADSLVTRLVAAGHKAYIRPVVSAQGTLHGVFVGPVPTRNEAVALQSELKSRFQIDDAIVQRFDIAQ